MGLCRTCGVRLDAGATACLRCGTPAGEIKVGGDPADVVVDTGHEAAPSDETIESDEVVRRVPWPRVVGLGALGLVLVAALVWVVDLVRDDGSGDSLYAAYIGTRPLEAALTSRPRELWSRELAHGEDTNVIADRGRTFLVTAADRPRAGTDIVTGTVLALDIDGKELWEVDLEAAAWAHSVSPDGSTLLLYSERPEDEGPPSLVALSTRDGSVRWTSRLGYPFRTIGDDLLVVDDHAVGLVSLDTGKPRWTSELTDVVGLNDQLLVEVDRQGVTAYDLTSGEPAWSIDGDDAPCVALSDCSIAVAEDVVLVASITEAIAYDSADGARRWDLELDPGQDIGVAGEELVYVATLSGDGSGSAGPVRLYDADGERGEVVLDGDEGYLSPAGLTIGDRSYLMLTWDPAAIYDERFDRVATFDGDLMPVQGGAYLVNDGRLSYVRFDDPDPVWSLDGFNEDGVSLLPDEEGLVVQDGGTVTRYGE